MSKLNVAVLGATGAVGQRFIQLLADHPWFRVAEVVASDRSAGKAYAEACRWILADQPPADVAKLMVLPLDAPITSPVALSALPSDAAKTRELELAAAGHVVCSNTSSHRMADDVPILLPDINADHAGLIDTQRRNRGWTTGALATMSNCTAVPVIVALAPLLKFGIEAVNVVSMQAISGAGYPGVASLDIFDNVVPYIGGEEEKLESEPRKILGTLTSGRIDWLDTTISAACNRVPVIDSHLVCVSVRFTHKPTLDEMRAAWTDFRGHAAAQSLPSAPRPVIVYNDLNDRPQPRRDRDAGRGMTTTIGRLRPDPLFDAKFIALSHNTIRGAAGGAIFAAELLLAQGYVQRAGIPESVRA
ncbi:MAG TPA: aspartate-semialdehyde dehydrogenase [Aggregatilineales bacterium]|nr:aspartate-semialdehyde dehydrogenase [Aggregatilineales bacterium]